MLIRLDPQQVCDVWEHIVVVIRERRQGRDCNDAKMANLLRHVLDGSLIVWANMEEEKVVDTLILTQLTEEPVSETKNLSIFFWHSFIEKSAEVYFKIATSLKRFAESRKCENFVVYSEEDEHSEILDMLNGLKITMYIIPLENVKESGGPNG